MIDGIRVGVAKFALVFRVLLLGVLFCLFSCEDRRKGMSVIDFNAGWRFARFSNVGRLGYPMEPGSEVPEFAFSASSEAIPRDGQVAHIGDGDASTCWNSAARNGQWVQVDFTRPVDAGGVRVKWGFAGAPGVVLKVRKNLSEKRWIVVSDLSDNRNEGSLDVKFSPIKISSLKLELVRVPEEGWPRIAELEVLAPDGSPIPYKYHKIPGAIPASPGFDDTQWVQVDLPHDWAIAGPFSDRLDHGTGLLPWKGIGWYRKRFEVPARLEGKRLYLDFDGAMANAVVYLNGKQVGGWPYGYNSFRVDLSDAVRFGGENLVAVRLDTEHWGSRWYPGAGIYRDVRLVIKNQAHISHWGVAVTTPEISKEKARARVVVDVENHRDSEVAGNVSVEILDTDGKVVGVAGAKSVSIPAHSASRVALEMEVASPKLWSVSEPNLYTAKVSLLDASGRTLDTCRESFGIRRAEFTADNGFLLNGERVQIKGVCNHHDLGPLGAAVNKRALERQLEILKGMGCNAVRTSHNPPDPKLLDLCDRMGFLVMEEAFDCWRRGKRQYDYSALFSKWWRKDLDAMVRRDRNHPCVILWSIGNEVPDQRNPRMAAELAGVVRGIDPTRPVTLCVNSGSVGATKVPQSVDVWGYNYNIGWYTKFRKKPENASIPLVGSETVSCVSSRGEYFFPIHKNKRSDFQVTSYDIDYPGWGCTPDREFEALEKHSYVAGEFVWTGFDYIGEPTPYNDDATVLLNFHDPKMRERCREELEKMGEIKVPSRSSYFGIVDLCGFPKDRYYIYQARWRPDHPMAHIVPQRWNWSERVGKVTPVHVYTSGDEAELFLNGKSLGRRKKGDSQYRLKWDEVKYEPGELRVVAYKNGKKWAEDVVRTSGLAAVLKLTPDRSEVSADGNDLAFVTLRVFDANGVFVPDADIKVRFSVSGPGEIVATGCGDPANHESFKSSERTTFNGLALAIVRVKRGADAPVVVSAKAEGLSKATTRIAPGVHGRGR